MVADTHQTTEGPYIPRKQVKPLLLNEAEDESNRRIADAAGDNHTYNVGAEWRESLFLQLCHFQQGCPKNSRDGYKQREARRKFPLEAKENTPRNRRSRTRYAWDNSEALQDTDDERVACAHLRCWAMGLLSLSPPEKAARQEEHATDDIRTDKKGNEKGIDTQPEEGSRDQGQNDMDNGLSFAPGENARRRRSSTEEAGIESVNVVTEIGQERERGRNMKGDIIQEINFS